MKLTVWGKGPSSKLLAKALGVRRNRINADVVVRYGKVDPLPMRAKEINNADAIRLASNKYKSLCVMKEAGVKVPPFGREIADLPVLPISSTIFGRDAYHSKGTDIVVIERTGDGLSGFKEKDYYIQYLKSRAEYRYHVAFGKVILCTKKVLAEGEEDDSLIRNHQDGKWQQVVCVETPRFSEACIKAVQAHGLDFGAVDFLNVNREAVVLEVNTAPGMQVENRLEAYAKAIKEQITQWATR
jgi:glutathione synthase/RimK-type ligase-like ATP-grasp enzyme